MVAGDRVGGVWKDRGYIMGMVSASVGHHHRRGCRFCRRVGAGDAGCRAPFVLGTVILLNLHINQRILIIPSPHRRFPRYRPPPLSASVAAAAALYQRVSTTRRRNLH